MLKNSPAILPIMKRDFFELNCVHSDQWISQKWCHSDFRTLWSHLPCWLSKGPLKRDFLDIYLTTFFGIRNFGNTSAMRVTFLVKVFKILSTLQKCRKTLEKAFCFLDNYIWIGFVNFSLLRRESLWPAVNVFTNSLKI